MKYETGQLLIYFGIIFALFSGGFYYRTHFLFAILLMFIGSYATLKLVKMVKE